MIYFGDKEITNIYFSDKPITNVYKGNTLVWTRDKIPAFKEAVLADGGTFDEELFRSEFERQLPILQKEPIALLIPGAYKVGVIYGMNTTTGGIIPFTFSRASTGSYIDKNGVMQIAGNNIPRIDYSKGYPAYLLERSSTNLINHSNNFSNWSSTTITVDPTDIYTAFSKGYGRMISVLEQNCFKRANEIISSPNTTYRIRMYVRAGSVDSCRFGINGSDSTGTWGDITTTEGRIVSGPGLLSNSYGLCTVNNLSTLEDTCIEIKRTYTGSDPFHFRIYVKDSPANIGDSILVSTAQLEALPNFNTSQIDTSSSQSTRAKDNLSVYDLIGDEGSVYMECELPDLSGLNDRLVIRGNNNNGRFFYRNNATDINRLFINDGISSVSANNINSPGKNKLASSYKMGGYKKISSGGILNQNLLNGNMNSGSNFSFLESGTSIIHLQSLAFFPRQLSDQEHIDITQP